MTGKSRGGTGPGIPPGTKDISPDLLCLPLLALPPSNLSTVLVPANFVIFLRGWLCTLHCWVGGNERNTLTETFKLMPSQFSGLLH